MDLSSAFLNKQPSLPPQRSKQAQKGSDPANSYPNLNWKYTHTELIEIPLSVQRIVFGPSWVRLALTQLQRRRTETSDIDKRLKEQKKRNFSTFLVAIRPLVNQREKKKDFKKLIEAAGF